MNLSTRLVAEALMKCEDEVHYILTPQDNGYRSQNHRGIFAKTIGKGRVGIFPDEKDGIVAVSIESAEKVTEDNIIFTKGSIIKEKDWKKLFL